MLFQLNYVLEPSNIWRMHHLPLPNGKWLALKCSKDKLFWNGSTMSFQGNACRDGIDKEQLQSFKTTFFRAVPSKQSKGMAPEWSHNLGGCKPTGSRWGKTQQGSPGSHWHWSRFDLNGEREQIDAFIVTCFVCAFLRFFIFGQQMAPQSLQRKALWAWYFLFYPLCSTLLCSTH